MVVGTTIPLSRDSVHYASIRWAPDGKRLLFSAMGGAGVTVTNTIGLVSTDGDTRTDTLLRETFQITDGKLRVPQSFTPDGGRILMQQSTQEGARTTDDLLVADVDSAIHDARPYLGAEWSERDGAISPDGKWVAYVSNETKFFRVYVRAFPVPGPPIVISDSVGAMPRWSPDGRTILYWVGTRLMAATVRLTPDFAVVSRKLVFTRPGARSMTYDVSPDGKRVAVVVPDVAAEQAAAATLQPARLVLVVNWLEEFKRKVAGK
jgi:Tol biopolymer transport system component